MRRIYTLVRHLPGDSATATASRDGAAWWSVEAHLLDDLRIALTFDGKQVPKDHPSRPRQPRDTQRNPERSRRLAEARRRARERQAAIEAGEII